MHELVPILAIAVCSAILLQFTLWSGAAVGRIVHDRRQFELNLAILRRQLDQWERQAQPRELAWQGYRAFTVRHITREADQCVSIELAPEDGRPLPAYLPGQHLTLRCAIPTHTQPVVRCYSLSDAPREDVYRITVKALSRNGACDPRPTGLVSHYLCESLRLGQRLDVKAPAGSFHLNLSDRRPAVLVAGGIGVTPMIAMVNVIAESRIPRQVYLFYSVRNGRQHPFKDHLNGVARRHPNIRVITCYSQPDADDRPGLDYLVHGRVTADLIRSHVHANLPFYLCGPPEFMRELYEGLKAWGVADSDLHMEAFGPASIRRPSADSPQPAAASGPVPQITCAQSHQTLAWNIQSTSLLDLAEAHGLKIDSGCRAGNCGTCRVRLREGEVEYPERAEVECDPGFILACIARPRGDLKLDL
jgi:ferredoxin-NADP reductase